MDNTHGAGRRGVGQYEMFDVDEESQSGSHSGSVDANPVGTCYNNAPSKDKDRKTSSNLTSLGSNIRNDIGVGNIGRHGERVFIPSSMVTGGYEYSDLPLESSSPKIKSESADGGEEDESMISDDETEFGDNKSDSSMYYELSGISSEDSSGHLTSTILCPTKQTLIDRLMEQFWEIFNQEWSSNFRKCAGHEHTSTTPGGGTSGSQKISGSSDLQSLKRKRNDEDDDFSQSNGNNGQPSKQPVDQYTPPKASNKKIKLACPYRKHDRRIYSIGNFQSCVLGHWDSVGRVK